MNADGRRWICLAASAAFFVAFRSACADESADSVIPAIEQLYPDNPKSIVADALPLTQHIDDIITNRRMSETTCQCECRRRLPPDLFRTETEQKTSTPTGRSIDFAIPFSTHIASARERYRIVYADVHVMKSQAIIAAAKKRTEAPRLGPSARSLPLDEAYEPKHSPTIVEQLIASGFPSAEPRYRIRDEQTGLPNYVW